MRRLASSALALAALLLTATSLAAQSRRDAESDAEWLEQCRNGRYGNRWEGHACEVRAVPVARGTRSLSIDGASLGGVSVTGWDRDSIHISARIQGMAPTQAEAERAAREVRISAEGGTIRASGGSRDDDTRQIVSYDVWVPRHMDLDLRAHNGGLRVDGVTGRMTLETENGGLSLEGAGGDVRARAQNGGVNVRLTGSHWEGAGLDAETENGGVRLVVPENYSARLETGTVNGGIRTDIPITLRGNISRRISLTLGSGGAPVRATTTNGGVIIERD
jgi:Putative adhesin